MKDPILVYALEQERARIRLMQSIELAMTQAEESGLSDDAIQSVLYVARHSLAELSDDLSRALENLPILIADYEDHEDSMP